MTGETDPLLLASQLCSRLCHDMLSPVGALSNGLELLADEQDPQMRQRCFELLEQSAPAPLYRQALLQLDAETRAAVSEPDS